MKPFKILQKDGKARLGKLTTPHGVIDTPNFVPVGTQASVKSLTPKDLKEIGNQIILANTYHLMLRPGEKLIKKLGGLYGFMNWDRPIMTDSGGFQVLSIGDKKTEEGVTFRAHFDGSKHFLSPEKSMQIQKDLGADLTVAFDDHESLEQNYGQVKESLELTNRWALRSLKAFKKSKQIMYGVIHGSIYKDLRIASAKFIDANFDAIAIGGIYSDRRNLQKIIDWSLSCVSDEKPRHLLGIGEVANLFDGVERGIDFFDCVAPTRRARNGSLYTTSGLLNIRAATNKKDPKPVDLRCDCYTCQNFSRAYLHHLYAVSELTYHSLATYHNLYFINNLMKQIRQAIGNKQFNKLKAQYNTRP